MTPTVAVILSNLGNPEKKAMQLIDDARVQLPKDNVFRYMSVEPTSMPPGIQAPFVLKTGAEIEAERLARRRR